MLVGANLHFVRSEQGIDRLSGPMGSFLSAHFGSRLYVIGFTTWGGQQGAIFPEGDRRPSMVLPIEAPPADSFEDVCHRAGLPFAFVDLAHLPEKHWLGDTFVATPLGSPGIAPSGAGSSMAVLHRPHVPRPRDAAAVRRERRPRSLPGCRDDADGVAPDVRSHVRHAVHDELHGDGREDQAHDAVEDVEARSA
jgi:erythromycin esterase-like protein